MAATTIQQFEAELSADVKNGKAVFLLAAPEASDNEPSLDQLRALPRVMAPQAALDSYNKMVKELGKVGLDSQNDSVRMLDTASSHEGHKIIQGHLKKINKLMGKKNDQAFNLMLALTMAMKNDEYWYADTDVPEKVDEILQDLGGIWVKLFNQTPESLGITPSGRTAIEGMLQKFQEDLKASGYEAPWPREGRW